MGTPGFFLDTRHQKRSLAGLNDYFRNEVDGKKNKLPSKIEFLELSLYTVKKKGLQSVLVISKKLME